MLVRVSTDGQLPHHDENPQRGRAVAAVGVRVGVNVVLNADAAPSAGAFTLPGAALASTEFDDADCTILAQKKMLTRPKYDVTERSWADKGLPCICITGIGRCCLGVAGGYVVGCVRAGWGRNWCRS